MMLKKLTVLAAPALAVAALNAHAFAGKEATVACPKAVLVQDNSTSGNARGPSSRYASSHSVYLITASELATNGYPGGATPTSIGWSYQTAPGVPGTASLKVYLQNTADIAYTKGASFAAAIVGMTKVHDASTTVPAAAGPFDIPFSGGSPFTYTGGGLYVAYEWGVPTPMSPPLSTTMLFWCNSLGLPGGLMGNNSALDAMTASAFRPETRLNGGTAVTNDAAVTLLYAMGEVSTCQPPQVVSAVVTNIGADTLINLPVTLTVTGPNAFTDTQNVASLAGCGGKATVTFAPFSATNVGSGSISVSVPSDSAPLNNSLTRFFDVSTNTTSYKHPGSTSQGGVGFTGGTGAFVAKFNASSATSVTDVKLEFFAATITTYKVVIYSDNGSGAPSITTLYLDATDRTVAAAGPVTITLPSPVPVGPGNFWVGIQQTNITNANYSFDNEDPIRAGTFFYGAGLPVATWVNFSPGTNFKLNVGIIDTGCVATPCPADTDGNGVVDVDDLVNVILNWGCVGVCVGDTDGNNTVDVDDLVNVILAWGPC